MSKSTITAAIYARKSVYTETSESIASQIQRCIEYCKMRGWDYFIYNQDEGFSGKDTFRPDFQKMMRDAAEGKFQYIISYKLDRISRSILDFSDFITTLQELGINYVSITENFDTSTPVGRAMMYIVAVFAQLERETIAERVRDNMVDRAKEGHWNGGPVNYGFDRVEETQLLNGKVKKQSKLVINEYEKNNIVKFFNWYLEPDGSVRNCVMRANKEGIKTKNGLNWNTNQMARLLSNPKYCIADTKAYDYYKYHTEVQIASSKEDFDGYHGLQYYNRRKPHKKTTRVKDESEWILAVGDHAGIIPSDIWIEVQHKINRNKDKAPRLGTGKKGLFPNLIKCKKCGSSMTYYISKKSKNADGYDYAYYRCRKRESQGKHLCNQKNIRADYIENAVINQLKAICSDREFIENAVKKAQDDLQKAKEPLLKEASLLMARLESNNREIKNLVIALGKNTLPHAVIEERINELDKENEELKSQLDEIDKRVNLPGDSINIEYVLNSLKIFNESFDKMDFEEKRQFLQCLIESIEVDDDKISVNLFFMPHDDSSVFLCRTDKDSWPLPA